MNAPAEEGSLDINPPTTDTPAPGEVARQARLVLAMLEGRVPCEDDLPPLPTDIQTALDETKDAALAQALKAIQETQAS